MRLECFLLLLSFLCINAQTFNPGKQRQVDQIIEAVMDCSNIAGFTLSAVHNEEVFSNGYGVQDLDIGDPVDTNSMFVVASVTKHFTTTLLGMVLEENGLSWDTTVREILGADFFLNDGLRSSLATLKDLASHSVGQPRRDFLGFITPDGNNRRDAAFNARHVPPQAEFRDSLLYNNHMFEILAYITEFLSGEIWEDLMTEKILKPAGMTSTTPIFKLDLQRDDIARPYESNPLIRINDTVNAKWARLGGSGSLTMNAADMAKWLMIQANEGRIDGVQIIPASVVRETQTAHNLWPFGSLITKPTMPVTLATTGYGLGLQIGWYRGHRMISHGGYLYGYNTLITVLPDVNIGVFTSFTGNTDYGRAIELPHSFVMDLLLGEEPWLDTTTICTFPEPWSPLSEKELMKDITQRLDGPIMPLKNINILENLQPLRHNLSPYIGQYGDFFYGNLTIFADDSQTRLFLRYGDVEPWEILSTEQFLVGVADRSVWPLHIFLIAFSKSDEALEQYDIVRVYFDADLPTFVRDLKMSDAPPPPDPNNCS